MNSTVLKLPPADGEVVTNLPNNLNLCLNIDLLCIHSHILLRWVRFVFVFRLCQYVFRLVVAGFTVLPNLRDVFRGDFKVQLAIDVDFPEVLALMKILKDLADLSASLVDK